ncbi:hypothetical protein [Actibacterium sp. 188UL27-1]|uniref:hypothetical protein n=1 Tax=Actibacterium sp. 188UL27-1 TaxID=2786961 RepID=UPI00195B7034|nr:hypothetical protein [Actibacterium sp. 188UL27-1]MBM7066629.1 hypothetical protein [Actibacterium sp. 188UL27-1]
MSRRTLILLIAVLAAPAAAQADTEKLFDRYKTASLQAAGNMMAFYETCAPGIGEKVPPVQYDAPMDTATACVIDEYVEQKGLEAAEALVVEVENWADKPITTVEDLQLTGEQASSPELQGIVQACGVVEASSENPTTKAIMENAEMLAPCFGQ